MLDSYEIDVLKITKNHSPLLGLQNQMMTSQSKKSDEKNKSVKKSAKNMYKEQKDLFRKQLQEGAPVIDPAEQ